MDPALWLVLFSDSGDSGSTGPEDNKEKKKRERDAPTTFGTGVALFFAAVLCIGFMGILFGVALLLGRLLHG